MGSAPRDSQPLVLEPNPRLGSCAPTVGVISVRAGGTRGRERLTQGRPRSVDPFRGLASPFGRSHSRLLRKNAPEM
jgi:hypothetical protein